MLRTEPWKLEPNGVFLMQSGNVRLLVEKVGWEFRVLVSRAVDELQPERLVYAGSAGSADDAMRLAEQEAERALAGAAD